MGEHRRAAVASWPPPVPIVITEASDMDQMYVLVEPEGCMTVNEWDTIYRTFRFILIATFAIYFFRAPVVTIRRALQHNRHTSRLTLTQQVSGHGLRVDHAIPSV